MREEKSVLARHVTMEPGDGTHYEFIVSTVPGKIDSYYIASVARGAGCPTFAGYAYRVADLMAFAKRNHELVDAIGTDRYRHLARVALSDFHVAYAMEHSSARGSQCNPWTALAGLLAGATTLELA